MSAKINFFAMSAIFFAQNPDNPQWLFLVKLGVQIHVREKNRDSFPFYTELLEIIFEPHPARFSRSFLDSRRVNFLNLRWNPSHDSCDEAAVLLV